MKISTLKLTGGLVLLVAIYFAIDMFGSKSKSRGVRSELVNLDAEQVDYLSIKSSQNEVLLTKEGEKWKLTLASGKSVYADKDAVIRSIEALNGVKPSRLASKKKEKWSEYQVDSTGTRVIAKTEGKNVLDLVIGKFSMVGQRSFQSFVRLFDDEATYVVADFMPFSVPSDPSSYRVRTVTNFNSDSLNTIKFIYRGDSSFMIEKNLENQWVSDGQVLDSLSVAQYLSNVNRLSSVKFHDQDLDNYINSERVEFVGLDGKSTVVSSYQLDSTYLVQSSVNEESIFEDATIHDKLFLGLQEFK